jgi:hemolysin D
LFAAAIAWACIGEVDIVAVAPGRIIVSERSKIIQPLEAGTVKAIHVQDGSKVKAGQVLIELDATQSAADVQRILQDKQAAQIEQLRAEALMGALEGHRQVVLANIPGLSRTEVALAQQQLQAEWADIQAKLQKFKAEEARRLAEVDTVEQQIKKLRTTLPLAQQRESDYRTLTDQGYVSGHLGQDRTRERIELETDLGTAQARQREAMAALEETRRTRDAFQFETLRTLRERHTQALLKFKQFHEESAKAGQRNKLMTLTAPVEGTVQQLAVHTTGGVVTPAQQLMVIVPSQPSLMAEVTLENKDIGFVKVGQTAQVKIETLPFTRYGTVAAEVTRISGDAVIDEKRGALFAAGVVLQADSVSRGGMQIKLSPGMNVTVEILTGKRRVIDYVAEPIWKELNESIGER